MRKKIILLSLGLTCLLCLLYSLFEPYWVEEKHFTIERPDIPINFSGKKVVFLTDLHCGPFFSPRRLASLVDQVNALAPELILLGGDYVDGPEENIDLCFKELARLKSKSSMVMGVLGNHDIDQGEEKIKQAMERANIAVLNNRKLGFSSEKENANFEIAGIDDPVLGDPNIEKAISGITEDAFSILLSHTPDITEDIKEGPIDLVLSGHTHGGQITFFGLWAPITMSKYGQKYVSGSTKERSMETITSNGIGTVVVPMRFFARPQIVVLDLKKTNTVSININGKQIKSEVARTKEEITTGLMKRESLCQNCGMLFVFNEEDFHSFWMKNTLIPLDMVFINKNKKVVDIKRAVPCENDSCPLYQPREKALYVLETNAKTFSDETIGQSAIFDLK